MRLWTVQPANVLEQIEKTGTFRCNKELSFNLSKKDSLEDKYLWLIERMENKIGARPSEVEFPVWAWHTWEGERRCPDVDSGAFLKRDEDKVLLTLEVPDDKVVLTDFDAWQIVLNDGFLTNETDEQALEKLEEYIDSLDGKQLLDAIRDSWENVFEIGKSGDRGQFVQATLWEIKKEYIVESEILKAVK